MSIEDTESMPQQTEGASSFVRIIVDSREPKSMDGHLAKLGVEVERDHLPRRLCALVGLRGGAEDRLRFHRFPLQRKALRQVTSLKEAYAKPVIIVEGDIESELDRRKNPRAYWGAIMKLQAEMNIPIVVTPTAAHTADALYTLAKRLQKEKTERFVAHNKPRLMSSEDWRLFIIASLPFIGDELASRLLAHFKSVRKIFLATENELEEVEGIGKSKAKRISELLDEEF